MKMMVKLKALFARYWWVTLAVLVGLVSFMLGRVRRTPDKPALKELKTSLENKALKVKVELMKEEAKEVAKTAHKRAELEFIDRQEDDEVRRELLSKWLKENL